MTRPGIRDAAWMAVGALGLLIVLLLVMQFRREESPGEQLAARGRRVALVERMRLGLASASEAEKSAVMAITDEDSQAYADQARAATGAVEQAGVELEALLATSASPNEQDLLREFTGRFGELERIDAELLDLAVRNTNLKAARLAFGPSAARLEEVDAALIRVMKAKAAAGDLKVIRLADDARIAALRIQALLPPHIAEESDQAMDEMEQLMVKHDRVVRESLAELAALPALRGSSDLESARSAYARFTETRTRILELSRANTNVRSLAISLSQKRKATLVCQDALDALENAIDVEPVPHAPVNPR
jgi:hypothetical protein